MANNADAEEEKVRYSTNLKDEYLMVFNEPLEMKVLMPGALIDCD